MNQTSPIVLAGGSGFLGRSLTSVLISMGHDVVVLGRAAARKAGRVHHAQWDGKTLGEWHKFLDGATAVVNLTGKSVNCRYTPENKREIIESRVNSVRVLAEAIAKCTKPPAAFIQAVRLRSMATPAIAGATKALRKVKDFRRMFVDSGKTPFTPSRCPGCGSRSCASALRSVRMAARWKCWQN